MRRSKNIRRPVPRTPHEQTNNPLRPWPETWDECHIAAREATTAQLQQELARVVATETTKENQWVLFGLRAAIQDELGRRTKARPLRSDANAPALGSAPVVTIAPRTPKPPLRDIEKE